MKLTDNIEVQEFLGKAQSKIGELGTYIASRKHDSSSLALSKELIDVVNAFISCDNKWTLETALKIVHYYNLKAELNNIPYMKIIGYEVRFNKVIGGGGKTTTVNDLTDYISRTIELINNTQHNSLKGIQGGKIGEYYHLDKTAYDWVMSQVYKFISPTVNLTLVPSTLMEKGKSLSNILLDGDYTINSAKSALKARYYRASTLLVEYIGIAVNNNYVDNSTVRNSTTYKYEVDFEEGGTKNISKMIEFVLPYYSDVKPSGLNIINANKVLSKKPASMDITFSIPANNATTMLVKPYVMYDRAWGLPRNVYVDGNPTFDTAPNWKALAKEIDKVLEDGTIGQYYLLEYNVYTEGTFTFNFKF